MELDVAASQRVAQIAFGRIADYSGFAHLGDELVSVARVAVVRRPDEPVDITECVAPGRATDRTGMVWLVRRDIGRRLGGWEVRGDAGPGPCRGRCTPDGPRSVNRSYPGSLTCTGGEGADGLSTAIRPRRVSRGPRAACPWPVRVVADKDARGRVLSSLRGPTKDVRDECVAEQGSEVGLGPLDRRPRRMWSRGPLARGDS